MTNYSRGYNFELRTAKHLEDEGYFVITSRGSHGPADMVAVKRGVLLAVQCKTDGKLSVADWNGLCTLASKHLMVPILACRDGRRLVLWELTGWRERYVRVLPRREYVTDQVAAA